MEILGNKLSYRTYRHTKVNDVDIFLPNIQERPAFPLESSKDYREIPGEDKFTYGVAKEVLDLNRNLGNVHRFYHAGPGEDKDFGKVILETTDDHKTLLDSHDIFVEEGAKCNLILSYREKGDLEKFRNSIIRIQAEKNAEVTVFIVQTEDKSVSLESVLVLAEEGAKVRLRQYEMGALKNYMNTQVELLGEKADVDVRSIYFGHEEDLLNILYHANHHASESKCKMIINGALMDESYKNLKTTLDFKEGSSKSQGEEAEYTVLLDDEVLNVSVPVLLAHEDDIQGNHAASSGKIDADLLFYLKSRGIDHSLAETLIVESKYASTIDLLEDQEEKELIWTYFRHRMENR